MKTKLFSVITFLFLFTFDSFAQAPNWIWAKKAGGSNNDIAYSSALDAAGNLFVAGYFTSSSITFGSTTLNNIYPGDEDIFIVKYDPNGILLWAKRAGESSTDVATAVAVDGSGNIYLTGWFDTNSITFGTFTLNSSGMYDIFLVKYDGGNGNVIWAKKAGGGAHDYATSLSTDTSGNVLVTGYFESTTITFGTITLTNIGPGHTDVFIAKYDNSGNVLWAKSAGGVNNDERASSVATDVSGNAFIAGNFNSSTFIIGPDTLTSAGGAGDIFIAKYDTIGNLIWVQHDGGIYTDLASSLATDLSGNVYVAGSFESPTITFGTYTFTNLGFSDNYITKYDANGNVLWAKSEAGTSYDQASDLTTDTLGNVFMIGTFDSPTLTFGSTTLTNASAGTNDFFVTKYDANGNVAWSRGNGGTNVDVATSISIDASGNIFLTGYFKSPSLILGPTTLSTAGMYDVFIARLDNTPTGIENSEDHSQISVFPNPSSGILTITIPEEIPLKQIIGGEISIYNMLGEKVFVSTITNSTSAINLSNKPNGIYLITINTRKESFTKRIIINH